jgi:hypothetical protein
MQILQTREYYMMIRFLHWLIAKQRVNFQLSRAIIIRRYFMLLDRHRENEQKLLR